MNVRLIPFGPVMALVLLVAPLAASAQSAEGSFLTDYSRLKAAPDNPFEEVYIAPSAQQQAKKYTAVMIDQPELFLHPDSKYKGMKPDDMKAIADTLREAVTAELRSKYRIVDAAGPDVLYVRLAVGDLAMQKKKRPILAYTPAGAVLKAVKDSVSDVTGKVELRNMKIEGEVLDSVTQQQLGAMTASRGSLSTGSNASQPVSWKELRELFVLAGKRLRCRLDNASLPQAEWAKCGSIGLTAAAT